MWCFYSCLSQQPSYCSCLTVAFTSFSSQMFYLKTWACAIIPLFNLQKDITQKDLIEHKGLWIRMKVQRSVTAPQPGSIWMPHSLDSMKKDGLLSINVMVNCLFYDLTNSKQKQLNLWPWRDSSHSSFPPVEKFQRSTNGHFSVINEGKNTYPMGKSTSAPWSVMW